MRSDGLISLSIGFSDQVAHLQRVARWLAHLLLWKQIISRGSFTVTYITTTVGLRRKIFVYENTNFSLH
jgi:hypothetical protein